ncbi:MAG: hypothetical protein RJA70_943 [Pseudomonadota bacterium]|jgi:anti-sigma factor RsiW
MNCRTNQSLIETFVDGELPPAQVLEVESHLKGCETCAEYLRFAAAFKISTQDAVRAETVVSDSFRQRLGAATRAEELRENAMFDSSFSARRAVPALATAAAILLLYGSQNLGWLHSTQSLAPGAATAAAVFSPDLNVEAALDSLIDYHSSPPEPQVTQQDLLPGFEQNVGVRVRLPADMARFGAQWEGANLIPMRNSQAASLRYRMPGHRVTLYVYDPRKVPVQDSLQQRLVLDQPIYLGEWRGYSIAAKQHRGVGYALATDLDDARITELITAIH